MAFKPTMAPGTPKAPGLNPAGTSAPAALSAPKPPATWSPQGMLSHGGTMPVASTPAAPAPTSPVPPPPASTRPAGTTPAAGGVTPPPATISKVTPTPPANKSAPMTTTGAAAPPAVTPPGVPTGTMSGATKGPTDLMGMFTNALGIGDIGDRVNRLSEAYNAPPLTHYTGALGGIKPVADKILGVVQNLQQNNPAGFTQLVASLGGDLSKGLAGTPFGIPAMLGIHGLAAGGDTTKDVMTYFSPLLKNLGIG